MTKTQKRIYDLTHAPRNGWDIAGEIAAEIDALTERNAFLLTSAETAQAKLAECRKQCETIAVMRNLEVQPELADALGRISTLEAEVQRLENARLDQG